ncbi:MAG: lipid A deacylase LpxR family protein [bacterium]
MNVRAIVCALLTAAPIGAAVAQSPVPAPRPHTLTLRIDNDAFDFWMQPYNRPDEEYTSGVHITYDGGDAPWWSRALLRGDLACTTVSRECRMGRLELGQDIYTPLVSSDNLRAVDGSRPNAGWLYLAESARRLHDRHSDELTLTLGVTGPPSLARTTQTLAHRLAPEFNRPTDWSRQIRFEPGVIARYERRERIGSASAGPFAMDIVPRVAAAVGNVSTAAELGLQTRLGWHLAHPWLPSSDAAEFAIVAGVSGRAVARDLFLDGSTGGQSPDPGHEAFVGAGELGVELRFHWLNLSYRAVSETRAYAGGPKWHPWASMVGGVTFDR